MIEKGNYLDFFQDLKKALPMMLLISYSLSVENKVQYDRFT